MSDKGLNLFEEYGAECVHLHSGRIVYLFFLRGQYNVYTPGTIANSQRTPTEINKNGATAKVRILVGQVILYSI